MRVKIILKVNNYRNRKLSLRATKTINPIELSDFENNQ